MAEKQDNHAKKKQRVDDTNSPPSEAAFAGSRSIKSSFTAENVLRFDGGGKFVVLKGTIEGLPALVQLEQRAACDSKEEFVASLRDFQLELTNYSGAEYSNYTGAGLGASWNVEAIWPASERQIQRKTPSEKLLVEESGELYNQVIATFAQQQAERCNGWVDNVVNLKTELERNLFHNENFIINVDTKWKTHTELSANVEVRKTWYEAPFTDGLYLLAIAKNPGLRSLRDLVGEEGALLCDEMRDELRSAAMRVYGVPASQLRIMFHYHPQFYRLHAHCVRINAINPGSEVERAHLLTTVAFNLRMNSDYYKNAMLSYKVHVGEGLHKILLTSVGNKGGGGGSKDRAKDQHGLV